MRKLGTELLPILIACCGLLSLGCTPQTPTAPPTSAAPPMAADDLEHVHDEDEHGDHFHANNYNEAVSHVEKLRDEIKAAFDKGEGDSADGAVHSIGHALEDMGMLAKKAEMSPTDQEAVGVAVESLLDAFGKIDEKIHNGVGAVYKDVENDIDTAFDTLKKFVK